MEQALSVHRLHFAFTIVFHYIFLQLTRSSARPIVYLKTKALRTNDEHYDRAVRFWSRIFGINFAVGVVTGIPMELVRHELGHVFTRRRWRHRADPRHGRRVFVFSGVHFPYIYRSLPGKVVVAKDQTHP